MKKSALFTLSILLSTAFSGYAQQPTLAPMESTTTPSKTMEGTKTLQNVQPIDKSKSGSAINTSKFYGPPPTIKVSTPVPRKADYFHPGIIVDRDGVWEGSDQLLNLTNNIGVYVSILKPEEATLAISEAQIQKHIEAIFQQAKIKSVTMAPLENPPLPFFELEILLYPVDRGYVACLGGRLFESVTLSRFKLDPEMAFQAVTWEKQTLIVGPKTKFLDQLTAAITEISGAFAERFETFEKLKK